MKFLWLLACIGAARAALVAPPAISFPTARAAPRRAAATFVTMEDKPQYSREVQMKAEMESPLQQARFFFFYPAVVVGASLAAYVSVIRIVAGVDEHLIFLPALGGARRTASWHTPCKLEILARDSKKLPWSAQPRSSQGPPRPPL